MHECCFQSLVLFHCSLQESVVANLHSLDILLGWMQKRKGGREVVRQAIDALQELFCSVLLPDRKLRHFEQQPLQVSLLAHAYVAQSVATSWLRKNQVAEVL
jgi:ribosome biogenesis protein MAK21